MVIKICKICGKEFNARGAAKCCSSECSKINRKNSKKKYQQSDKGKATGRRAHKKYRESDKGKKKLKEYQKEYTQSEKGKAARRRAQKKYKQSNKGKETDKRYIQNKIVELNEKFDGDLDAILENCPTIWHLREAIMQVEYGVSYVEAMYQKEQINPVCEITGESGDLVNHHLDSFNTHPEKGADLDNIIRIKSEIHDEFHNIYGRGNNTREQWFEFLEKNRDIYI